MPRRERAEGILGRASALEKRYDWVETADLYEQALGAVGKKDSLRKGEIQERIGLCFHRAAMQAGSQEEFRERMQRAVEAYEEAHGFYGKLADEQKAGRISRCDAVAKYLRYWLTSDPSEKRELLDECLELKDKALTLFSESGDMLEYGRTYNELPLIFFCRVVLEWNRQTSKSIVEKGLEWGEKAVAALHELNNLYEIARANCTLAMCLIFLEAFIKEPEEKEKNRLKVVNYLSKAVDVSEKVGDDYLLGWSHQWLGSITEEEESVRHYEKTLKCGKRTRDNWLIAAGLDELAYMTYWKAIATENPNQRSKLTKEAMKFYDKAEHHLSIMSFVNPKGMFMRLRARGRAPPAGHAEHYLQLSMWETDHKKRLEFLEKSEKAGMKALKLAEDSDIPTFVLYVLHVASKTLEARARIEPDPTEKRSRLEKAFKYRKKAIEILEQLAPFDYYARGVMQNYLADIKAELADIDPDFDTKRRLLEEAVLSKERCLKLCNKMIPYFERMGDIRFFAALQPYQDTYATLLTRLYNLTNKPQHLRKAIEISQKAIESASKVDIISLMAESYWKIARAQEILSEHLKAAENFEYASESYMKAAEKIPQLKDFYQDHASYMRAWNEIEKARHHHTERQYGRAREHYEKAADLHKSTERWNYLSPNYLAWARLEEAEDLSRREQTEEARDLFQEASKLFAEAKKSIHAKLGKIESRDEKELLVDLAKASDIRREYSLGRIALEEAKILDRKGDHAASSRKYGFAAEKFQIAADAMEHESDRQELRPIVCLCRAWQVTTQAEVEASPDLYLEASRLFDEAKGHSFDEKAKVLALGHSSFCKALEAGTRFEATRDKTLYSAATRQLESAASYYVRAGFKTASEYAKATQRLFDAYVYMYTAKKETDPGKKAQYYQMAEKLLQASAGSYMKAKHPEKSEEVRRLLESVKEEQQLAMSLTEVLHAPTTVSTTTSFSTPTPTHEQAVGLERFEHADVQANLILRMKEANVGEDVGFRIELVNAGKAPALLIKVDEIIPEGFEIKEVPEICAVEDRYLDLKGRRLNPLKTVDIKLTVKPQSKGTFSIKPRVLYIDEAGKYRSHEPEPVTITVKELGIKGWIKGER